MQTIPADAPEGAALVSAIQHGDLASLAAMLATTPTLATVRLAARDGSLRSTLHVVTDWPGFFDNGPAIATMLLAAGADPNVSMTGRHAETALHWAASSDDVEVAAALIDGGADIDAQGGSIDGTPLANAVGYGCWQVARLLLARGARVDSLWQAAALGLTAQVEILLAASPPPSAEAITEAFWQACHGGQRRMAQRLFALGADAKSPPDYFTGRTVVEVTSGLDTGRERLIEWLRGLGGRAAR